MPEIRFFEDSPDAGDPACICSRCGERITEAQVPVIRVYVNDLESRFHRHCWNDADGIPSSEPDWNDADEFGPYCEICGCELDWEDCDQCEDGMADHDCGEDTCCCLYPEPNVPCDQCEGKGGWLYCPNASAHPEETKERQRAEP